MALTMARLGAPVRIQNRPVARSFAATRQAARSAVKFQIQAAKVTLITPSGEEVIGEPLVPCCCRPAAAGLSPSRLQPDLKRRDSGLRAPRSYATVAVESHLIQRRACCSALTYIRGVGQLGCPLSLAVSAPWGDDWLGSVQLSAQQHDQHPRSSAVP
jgi:hypothetical protein